MNPLPASMSGSAVTEHRRHLLVAACRHQMARRARRARRWASGWFDRAVAATPDTTRRAG